MQQEAAEQQSAHASSQQVCVDLIVECGPIVSMYSIELQQEYILFTCSHIQF
jgi:hypothetical protein